MKKTYIGFAGLSLVLLLGTQQVQAQQGFGTDKPAKTAAVDIQSSKRGLLIPRVELVSTTNDETPIDTPAQSLMVYNEKEQNDVTPGYYYWDTDRWVRFAQQGDITAINLGGDVTGPTNATVVGAIQGVEVSPATPTANQVLTFIAGSDGKGGQWVPTDLTEESLISRKGITGTGITVGGGVGATLKDVTLAITPGTENQVMVTNADGTGTTWVDQSTIAPATTNALTKKTTGEGDNTVVNNNIIVSTVNNVASEVQLVNEVSNRMDGTTLKTTVNGIESAGFDLKDAIQAGQKTTTVVPQDEKVTVVATEAGTNTEYTVGVDQTKFDLSKIGGSLLTTQITPGVDGQVLTTVGGDTPSVTWTNPAVHENIYTHDGTLINPPSGGSIQRKVHFGEFTSLFFTKDDIGHDFTFDNNGHVGLNMYGKEISSIGLLTAEEINGHESILKFSHTQNLSTIDANSNEGLRISAGFHKDIFLGTFYYKEGESNETQDSHLIIKGNGAVQVTNINEDAFKGAATDKVVVADATGVLKTVERKKVAPQFFYMPAVIFNTKTTGANLERDLYQDYVNQFTTASGTSYNIAHGANQGSLPYDGGVIASSGAPAVMDVFDRGELFYYITYYDTDVFANISINENGVLKYDIIGTATPASYMNIVFVIK
ncbi:hypothetical protein ACPDHL_15555 [Myroides sp. C15-4]|uniref:hypothetical protein n=1 Tax=Myroides sp. C15-4 TaxID=3400532 RepID=UPI003D2F5A9F